jgi:DNA excision repair protein ERCC-4
MKDTPRIICDTREQLPLEIPDMITRTLPSGDYSIEGCESRISLERKSLGDLYSVIGAHRDRFERELERLARMERAAIVIEANLADVLNGTPYSKVHPRAVIGSVLTWYARYGIAPIFAGNRLLAAATVRKILVKFALR